MRVYISGKISGTKDYMSRFNAAEKEVRSKGHIVVNPARVNAELPPETKYDEYMTMSLVMLAFCDSIYMTYGWWDSNGARMEHVLAQTKKMQIVYQKDPTITLRNYLEVRKLMRRREAARLKVRATTTNGKRLAEIVREEAASLGCEEAYVLERIYTAATQGTDFTWCANLKQIEERLLQHAKDSATRSFKTALDHIKEANKCATLGEDGMKAIRAKEAKENGAGD